MVPKDRKQICDGDILGRKTNRKSVKLENLNFFMKIALNSKLENEPKRNIQDIGTAGY